MLKPLKAGSTKTVTKTIYENITCNCFDDKLRQLFALQNSQRVNLFGTASFFNVLHTSTYIYQTFYFQSVCFLSSYSTKSAESILFVGKSVPVKIWLLQDVFARLGSSPRNTDQLLVLSAVNHDVETDSLSLGNSFHRLGSSVKLKGYWRWSADKLVVLSDYFTWNNKPTTWPGQTNIRMFCSPFLSSL